MRPLTIWIVFCIMRLGAFAQLHDQQWIQGDGPISVMKFEEDSISLDTITDNPNVAMFIGTANICDKEGNLLFFTNGIYVRNRFGNLMPNGQYLSYNAARANDPNYLYNTVAVNGSPSEQSVLILPAPGEEDVYYIFHYLTIDSSYLFNGLVNNVPLILYYSVVNMKENFGQGVVAVKNARLPIYEPMASSRMTAVKHGNGRDWWLIRHGNADNKYIKFLVRPDGIDGPFYQNIGPPFNRNGSVQDFRGTSVFNLAGDKMASCDYWGPIVVLDFDRCTGEFSNPVTIRNQLYNADSSYIGAVGLAFSPNGQYLYANNIFELNQYDLWADDYNDSVRLFTVEEEIDGYWLGTMRLSPAGEIYIATWNGGSAKLHVIHHPDSAGLACGFEYNGQNCITINTVNLPNMVNYKLGAAVGSGCDTVVSGIDEIAIANIGLQLFPNPVQKNITVRTKQYVHQAILRVLDALGRVIYENSNFYQEEIIDLERLSQGIYFVEVSNKMEKFVGKFVKE